MRGDKVEYDTIRAETVPVSLGDELAHIGELFKRKREFGVAAQQSAAELNKALRSLSPDALSVFTSWREIVDQPQAAASNWEGSR